MEHAQSPEPEQQAPQVRVPLIAWFPIVLFVGAIVGVIVAGGKTSRAEHDRVEALMAQADRETDGSKARSLYAEVLKIDEHHGEARKKIDEIDRKRREEIEKLRAQARAHVELGYWSNAKKILEELVDRGVADDELRHMLLTCEFKLRAGHERWSLPKAVLRHAPALLGDRLFLPIDETTIAIYQIDDLREVSRSREMSRINSDLLAADDRVFFATAGGITALGEREWKTRLPYGMTPRTVLAAGESHLFVLLEEKLLVCLDQEAGRELWKFPFDGKALAGPVVGDGRVFLATDQGKVLAIRSEDGAKLWETKDLPLASAPPTLAGDHVLLPCESNILRIEATSGKVVGKFAVPGAVYVAPAVSGEVAFFVTAARRHVGVRATDGTVLWTVESTRPVFAPPAAAAGKFFVAADDLLCIDGAGGRIEWRMELETDVRAAVLLHRGAVFICGEKVTCVDSGYDQLGGWNQAGGGPERRCVNR